MKLTVIIAANLLSLAAMLMLPMSAAVADTEDTESEAAKAVCEDNWVLSDASRTCLPTQVTGKAAGVVPAQCVFVSNCVVNMDCTLDKPCTGDSGATVQTNIVWLGWAYEVPDLNNCGGTIQIEACTQ